MEVTGMLILGQACFCCSGSSFAACTRWSWASATPLPVWCWF